MSNELHHILQTLKSIDHSFKEQNRIFSAMNQNLFALANRFKEWTEQQEMNVTLDFAKEDTPSLRLPEGHLNAPEPKQAEEPKEG